jgi:hypothetical protein
MLLKMHLIRLMTHPIREGDRLSNPHTLSVGRQLSPKKVTPPAQLVWLAGF